MNTRKLLYFLAIIEHASVRRAAEKLNVAQPTISQALQSLEEDLGMRLLNRSRSGVSVTSAGELVALRAREILGDVERLTREAKELQQLERGEVRLGVVTTISTKVFAPFISEAAELRPNVKIIIERDGSEQLWQRIVSGELDLALAMMPKGELSSEIVGQLLLKDPYVIWMQKNHPLAEKATLKAKSMRKYPWTFSTKWRNFYPELKPLREFFGEPLLQPTVDSSEMDMAAALMEKGNFLSICPKKCFADAFNSGLFIYKEHPIKETYDLGILRRARREPSPATKQTIKDLSRIFKN